MLSRTDSLPLAAVQNAIVAHPAWRQARADLLEATTTGRATLALLGESGTGKSWLLRYIEKTLGKHGQAVTLLRQGDLPWALEPDTVLLIDEASRLSERALAVLAAQRITTVILADLPSFRDTLERVSPSPRIITLPPLAPQQVAGFVSEWLRHRDRDPAIVTQDALARLIAHSGGTPRLVSRLLDAALAFAPGEEAITGGAIDEVAHLRWNPSASPLRTAEPKPAPVRAAATPQPSFARSWGPRAGALAALAAAGVLALGITGTSRNAHRTSAKALSLQSHAIEAAAIPVPAATPQARIPLADLAPPPSPAPRSAAPRPSMLALAPKIVPSPAPPLTAISPPSETVEALADTDLGLEQPTPGEPGLIIIARRGDTLHELYASLYRGVEAPSFAEVVAVNPKPVVPGTVVIFPAPAGGWRRR